MPTIYLSPSTQEANEYVTGGSEEYYINLLADKMEPYLRSSGIGFTRNTPEMTAVTSIRASNAGDYDLQASTGPSAAATSTIIPAPSAGSVPQRRLPRGCGRSTRAPSGRCQPLRSAKCASRKRRRFLSSWPIMTTSRTQTGSPKIWTRSPPTLSSP